MLVKCFFCFLVLSFQPAEVQRIILPLVDGDRYRWHSKLPIQFYFTSEKLVVASISLARSSYICSGISNIPHRSQCCESPLSKQFNVNTVTLFVFCLSGYCTYGQEGRWQLWPLPANALWFSCLSLDPWLAHTFQHIKSDGRPHAKHCPVPWLQILCGWESLGNDNITTFYPQ